MLGQDQEGLIKRPPGTSLPWKTPEGFSSFFFSLISSPGNGYIEGKELENFFQELESTRKGAGVVRGSPGFAPSFPASLLPQILGCWQLHLAGAWLGGRWEHRAGSPRSPAGGDPLGHRRVGGSVP